MQDAEALVYQVLESDAELIALLGSKVQKDTEFWNRIYNSQIAPNSDEYPRVTLFEVINSDAIPGDDEAHGSDVNVRIDVWTKDEATLFDIARRIKKVLKNTFYACVVRLENKMYEPDTQVYHKPINVYLLLEQESDT